MKPLSLIDYIVHRLVRLYYRKRRPRPKTSGWMVPFIFPHSAVEMVHLRVQSTIKYSGITWRVVF